MPENRIAILVSGYKGINLGQDIEVEYASQQELPKKNLHDYHIVFARDISQLNVTDVRIFLNKALQSPRLILLVPSQWIMNYALHPTYLVMNRLDGRNVGVVGTSWLGKLLLESSNKIKLSYESSFSLPREREAYLTSINMLNRVSGVISPFGFEPVAKNPSGDIVSFILRWQGEPTFILVPVLEGPEDELEKIAKLTLEKAIKMEARYKRKGEVPEWITTVLQQKRAELNKETERVIEDGKFIELVQGLYYQTGEELEETVGRVFGLLGLRVEFKGKEKGQRDLILEFSNRQQFIMEIKGIKGSTDNNEVSVFIAGNPSAKSDLSMMVNHYRNINPTERQNEAIYPPFTPAAKKVIMDGLKEGTIKSFYPLTTMELAKWAAEGVKDLDLLEKMEESKDRILGTKGLIPSKMKGQIVMRGVAVNSKTDGQSKEEKK